MYAPDLNYYVYVIDCIKQCRPHSERFKLKFFYEIQTMFCAELQPSVQIGGLSTPAHLLKNVVKLQARMYHVYTNL